MPAKTSCRIGMGVAISAGMAAALISASKHQAPERPAATADCTTPHITLILPLN
ncbi:MAG: hypothetical protein ACO1OX_03255 [Novosphingobium sp.]